MSIFYVKRHENTFTNNMNGMNNNYKSSNGRSNINNGNNMGRSHGNSYPKSMRPNSFPKRSFNSPNPHRRSYDNNSFGGSSAPVREPAVFKKNTPTAILPMQMTSGSSCLDLHSDQNVILQPGSVTKIDTGLIIDLPSGFELQIRPRSGLALDGIIVIFGTVDHDYKLPLGIIVFNSTSLPFEVKIGDRMAQMKIVRESNIRMVDQEGNEISRSNVERRGGFGSSGINSRRKS